MSKTNIILVGFMGTGKSATGHLIAHRLERTLVDMDSMIEDRAGKKISAIFEQEGEHSFRKMERDLVRELAEKRNLVVAAGGGVVINPENIQDFARTGMVVCLHATPTAILSRVQRESHRPLLENGDKEKRILDLLESRRPLYEAIPFQVDTTYLSPEKAADRVIDMYNSLIG